MRAHVLLRAAGWAVLAGCAVLAGAPSGRADLIIFKDGYVLTGKIRQEKVSFVDAATGRSFIAAKLDGFFLVEAGARIIAFSPNQVAEAHKQEADSSIDIIRKPRIIRYGGGTPLELDWDVDEVNPFNPQWERTITLNTYNKKLNLRRKRKVEQRVTELGPQYARLEAKYVAWTAYYATSELGPKAVRELLYAHWERLAKKAKAKITEEDKRFAVFRFLLQAGWYADAEEELKEIQDLLPEAKKRTAEARESLAKLKAVKLAEQIERAARVGQHQLAQDKLAQFRKDKVTPEMIGEKRYSAVKALEDKYRRANEKIARARKYLADAALLRGVTSITRKPVFKEALQEIKANLNPDTLARIEGFIGQAGQRERDIRRRRRLTNTEEELLALAVSGWLMGNDLAESDVDSAVRLWKARQFILQYLKTAESSARAKQLDSYGKRPAIPMDELAQLIRLLPPVLPEAEDKPDQTPKGKKNGLSPLRIRAGLPDGGKGPAYQLQLPPEYHPYRSYPVLIVLHGGGDDAKAMLKRWSELAAENGYILAAPEWGGTVGTEYQFSAEEHAAVTETLRDLRRRYQVDSDRVFLFGFGEGGTMAYDVGLSHPDLFAGVIPMAGRPKWFSLHYWPNAQYLPFYVIDGSYNGENSKAHQRVFKEWVRCRYPSLFVEYRGRGPEFFSGELPAIFEWMGNKKRFHPRKEVGLYGLGGALGQEFKTFRNTDNSFYWLSTDGVRDAYVNDHRRWKSIRPAYLTARVGSTNFIYVNTHGVEDVVVWFPPGLVDFEKPVTIRVNSGVAWKKAVPQRLETLLEDFYQRGDRQRLFLAKIRFRLK
jgi:pimeloyl-ACP methyl ester carboxylesterase